MRKYDVAIVGAGPGGYVAALRLGQLGKKVALIEKDKIGGVCLNYGCIPTKAIIHVAHLFKKIKWLREIGLEISEPKLDFKRIQEWKEKILERLRKGINYLLNSYSVEIFKGTASFVDHNKLNIRETGEEIYSENIIIATGSLPSELPNIKIDGKYVIDSTYALELKEIPKEILIIGGGAIGLEFGCAFLNLGSNVYVVEIMDQLLPGFDREVSEYLRRSMERRGAKIFLSSTVNEIKISNDKVKAIVNTKDGIKEIIVDKVLLSVGRKPNVEGLNIENVKVARNNKGFIITDEFQRTNISNIYAIGDITGPPFLAHRASKQGIIAAEVISGLKSAYDYRAIPSVYFTDPEIVSVGLNEGEIKDREILIGKFPFTALGRALAYGVSEGFVKIIADKKTNVILGVQAIGEGVSDLSGEIALALEMGATLEDLSFVMHPHPTLTEAIMEAAENALKKAIHILNK